MGQKQNRTRQKNKRGDIEKWDQTGSPEIPDRGETSEIPGLPSGRVMTRTNRWTVYMTRPNRWTVYCI